jgi:uncharacterized protein (DUF952 family)
MTIYKIALKDDWAAAEAAGAFDGSSHDKGDGFIHFSTASQLAETLRLYYANVEGVLLVAVDDAQLGDALKWERAPSRGEDFPHLYGTLRLSAVRWSEPLTRGADGLFAIPARAKA